MESGALRQEIRKIALKNASEYGTASTGAVLGKVLSKFPELKNEMQMLYGEVGKIVEEVNMLGKEGIVREASFYKEEFEAERQAKAESSSKHNFSIPGAEKGRFITRFPPEPGGYLHLGHAKAIFIEDRLRSIYDGKLLLYFDDTNAENEKQEFVDAIKVDLEWLGVKFDKEYYASDSLPILYNYARAMIEGGKAYVCLCDGEKIKEGRASGIPCEHKAQNASTNMGLWDKMMKKEFNENEAILRFNSDMKAINTTMRDPTLFRIKKAWHYRQGDKYSVWPTYDFCTPIMDSINGITDTLRDKRYEMRDELYYAILDALGLRKPRITSFAIVEIANNVTSKRKIREMIKAGLISGFDDVRLATIAALRKRGVKPEAIREFALSFGMGKSESVSSIEALLSINRRLIEKNAKRLFFVEKPISLIVKAIPEGNKKVSMEAIASGNHEKREYLLNNVFMIDETYAESVKEGAILKLVDLFTVKVTKVINGSIEAEYVQPQEPYTRIVWLNEGNYRSCVLINIGDLLSGDNFNKDSIKRTVGFIEGYVDKLTIGDVVQLEGRGFFKLDESKSRSFISL